MAADRARPRREVGLADLAALQGRVPAPSDRDRRRRRAAADDPDRDLRAVARHRRSAGGVAGPAPEAAVGGVLVRHRHAGARRLQPRRLRRARVAGRRPGGRAAQHPDRARDRPGDRLRPLARRDRDARHGRADVDPAGPARHRADGADQGEHRERDPRHHARRGAARGAAGAQPRADAARAALRRGGDRRRHQPAAHPGAPHPAQHGRAAAGAGAPTSAPRR